jgi:hypothetical protein
MINLVKGDLFKLYRNVLGPYVLPHIVNDLGVFGKGYSGSLSRVWKQPEVSYRKLKRTVGYILGYIQPVVVEEDTTVINMVAQHGIGRGQRRVSYSALKECLGKVALISTGKSIHMPKIGSDLGGGDWEFIYRLIEEQLKNQIVYIYEL